MTYESLALKWRPQAKTDHTFNVILSVVLTVFVLVGIFLATVDIPAEKRDTRKAVPDRIAKLFRERPKPPPKPKPEEKPKPKPPEPKREPLPNRAKPEDRKPLTKTQETARKKAEQSGLLAHVKELADLIDTSNVDSMISRNITKSDSKAASVDSKILTTDGGKGSGGVGGGKHVAAVGTTKLDEAQSKAARDQLLAANNANAIKAPPPVIKRGTAQGDGSRTEEDIRYVMDQNKNKLHSLYQRARRANPGLKGKLIIELTVLPSGKVSAARIKSSELNDPALEESILARILQFEFGSRSGGPYTLTVPVDFVPS
jgi:TonB family protein